ncbi:MAG: TonB-dependent receptor plug domain-containing protein [Pseudomonadota bacterium]
MSHPRKFENERLLLSACGLAIAVAVASPAAAQDADDDAEGDVVIVTGTRIQQPNVTSTSPINTIGIEEIDKKFTSNVERVFRDLPITIPGDGQNVNNGTSGRAEVDLRALGPERNLILIDGKRVNPHDIDGIVDINFIPVIMLERIDIVTGGASAVYGSDALSGATNFILRNDFTGVEIDSGYSWTAEGEGEIYDVSVIMGAELDGGRGHAVLAAGYTDRNPVLLADREYGIFGVSSTTGSGLGSPPPAPAPECSGNTGFTTDHASGVGSTTAIPATLNLRSGNNYQFRDDLSLVQDECARFNFNPFNYYQTPQRRWQAMTTANYEINEYMNMYARAGFASTLVDSQIAPSGTFGQTFTIPIMNPFFTDATRQTILDDLNTFAASQAGVVPGDTNGFGAAGIVDVNSDGVFDENDAFLSTARRRTLELGPRTSIFDTDQFQLVWGVDGTIPGMPDWRYDFSWQYGESDFVETRDGFTNLGNLQLGIDTVDPDQCLSVTGVATGAPCTPINIFGPVGSITQAQADSGFFIAIANDVRLAKQTVVHGSANGPIPGLVSPVAENPVAVAGGFEFRREFASSSPDECLKEAPTSCQGGAGGNRLPIQSEYTVWEGFGEVIIPLVESRPMFESLSVEAGYRYSDFSIQGETDTWKAGLNWEIFPGFRIRYMEQQAVRAPNIGEIGSPITTGLDNATFDPCSVGNPNPPQPGSTLFDLCVATGVPAALVGAVPDIISGQVNVFNGTDPNNIAEPETARTRTAGFVWEMDPQSFGLPAAIADMVLSVDYYRINIEDYIDEPTGQEALDACYVIGDPVACGGVVRIGGALTVSGTGAPAFFTNFEFFRAEGIEIGYRFTGDLGSLGEMNVAYNANYYLANELQTTSTQPVVDCNGRYGTTCDPVPQYRHTMRAGWNKGIVDASFLWRRVGSMEAQANEAAALFPAFRQVDAQNYYDLTFGAQLTDYAYVSGLVSNIAGTEPPILGNETGSTAFNSGNTFPSIFDTLGRVYAINLKLSF